MGTNYYARICACPHCGRADEDLHICKSLTMFRGYPLPGHEVLGVIVCVADWRRVLRERSDVRVFDEYDREHEIEQFIKDVDATPGLARRRQYDWLVDHGHQLTDDWLDSEGFSFCSREFS